MFPLSRAASSRTLGHASVELVACTIGLGLGCGLVAGNFRAQIGESIACVGDKIGFHARAAGSWSPCAGARSGSPLRSSEARADAGGADRDFRTSLPLKVGPGSFPGALKPLASPPSPHAKRVSKVDSGFGLTALAPVGFVAGGRATAALDAAQRAIDKARAAASRAAAAGGAGARAVPPVTGVLSGALRRVPILGMLFEEGSTPQGETRALGTVETARGRARVSRTVNGDLSVSFGVETCYWVLSCVTAGYEVKTLRPLGGGWYGDASGNPLAYLPPQGRLDALPLPPRGKEAFAGAPWVKNERVALRDADAPRAADERHIVGYELRKVSGHDQIFFRYSDGTTSSVAEWQSDDGQSRSLRRAGNTGGGTTTVRASRPAPPLQPPFAFFEAETRQAFGVHWDAYRTAYLDAERARMSLHLVTTARGVRIAADDVASAQRRLAGTRDHLRDFAARQLGSRGALDEALNLPALPLTTARSGLEEVSALTMALRVADGMNPRQAEVFGEASLRAAERLQERLHRNRLPAEEWREAQAAMVALLDAHMRQFGSSGETTARMAELVEAVDQQLGARRTLPFYRFVELPFAVAKADILGGHPEAVRDELSRALEHAEQAGRALDQARIGTRAFLDDSVARSGRASADAIELHARTLVRQLRAADEARAVVLGISDAQLQGRARAGVERAFRNAFVQDVGLLGDLRRHADAAFGAGSPLARDLREQQWQLVREVGLFRNAQIDGAPALSNLRMQADLVEDLEAGRSVHVLFVALEDLRMFNRFGHAVGDRGIAALGIRAREVAADLGLTQAITVYHAGGKEYFVTLRGDGLSPQAAEAKLTALYRGIADHMDQLVAHVERRSGYDRREQVFATPADSGYRVIPANAEQQAQARKKGKDPRHGDPIDVDPSAVHVNAGLAAGQLDPSTVRVNAGLAQVPAGTRSRSTEETVRLANTLVDDARHAGRSLAWEATRGGQRNDVVRSQAELAAFRTNMTEEQRMFLEGTGGAVRDRRSEFEAERVARVREAHAQGVQPDALALASLTSRGGVANGPAYGDVLADEAARAVLRQLRGETVPPGARFAVTGGDELSGQMTGRDRVPAKLAFDVSNMGEQNNSRHVLGSRGSGQERVSGPEVVDRYLYQETQDGRPGSLLASDGRPLPPLVPTLQSALVPGQTHDEMLTSLRAAAAGIHERAAREPSLAVVGRVKLDRERIPPLTLERLQRAADRDQVLAQPIATTVRFQGERVPLTISPRGDNPRQYIVELGAHRYGARLGTNQLEIDMAPVGVTREQSPTRVSIAGGAVTFRSETDRRLVEGMLAEVHRRMPHATPLERERSELATVARFQKTLADRFVDLGPKTDAKLGEMLTGRFDPNLAIQSISIAEFRARFPEEYLRARAEALRNSSNESRFDPEVARVLRTLANVPTFPRFPAPGSAR